MIFRRSAAARLGHMFVAFAGLSMVLLGCGSARAPKSQDATAGAAKAEAAPQAARESRGDDGAPAVSPVVPRKIIYNAVMDLVAEDVGKAEQELRRLVKQENGYIAKSDLQGATGSQRRGYWIIRIPVAHFDAFREALLKLGEVQKDSIDSQDVTDQFYDLEARIRTNKAEEESLRKMLAEASAQPQVLALRQELNRLRTELEVQQGQLNRLDKLSAMATFTITIQERRGYVPAEAPTFGTRLGRTFGDSFAALRGFGEGLTLVVVALGPWLPVAMVVGVPLWVLVRRVRQRLPLPAVPAAVTPPVPAGN